MPCGPSAAHPVRGGGFGSAIRHQIESAPGTRSGFPAADCGRSAAGSASPCQGEGRGFESRRPLEAPPNASTQVASGGRRRLRRQHPAAWPSGLGKGLQSPVRGFDSRRRLANTITAPAVFIRAISSVGEHYLDTVGVTGSIPVSPTLRNVRQRGTTRSDRVPNSVGRYQSRLERRRAASCSCAGSRPRACRKRRRR